MEHSIETYQRVLKSQCELEEEARKIAREVLCEQDVYGDSYGVPTIADIVETLVTRIKNPVSKKTCNCCGCLLESQCGGQL